MQVPAGILRWYKLGHYRGSRHHNTISWHIVDYIVIIVIFIWLLMISYIFLQYIAFENKMHTLEHTLARKFT